MTRAPDIHQADPDTTTLSGGGEMGARMRAHDWARTSLGPVEQWPQSLKTAVRIMLTSSQPMFVWWGEELINLYNDPYKAIVGGKHPRALGQPAGEVWREIWDQVGPRAQTAIRKNEGTYDEALLLIMERNGYPEETYYTFSYSPVPNDRGGTGGILCANTDDTQRVIGERQLALLRDLAARTADARTIADACALSAAGLATNPYDLPFALIYLVEPDQNRAVLAGRAGIAAGHPAAPASAPLTDDALWPFAEVLASHRPQVVPCLGAAFGQLPAGAWERSPRQAVVLPVAASGRTGRAGLLVAGLNPFRLFDDHYRGFLELVSSQIAASIANAQAYEDERRRAEELAELDRAKTAFFSNVSHEFRTPLTLMLSPLEDLLARRAGTLDPRDHAELDVVHRNGLRLLKLVNTLLDFSRIEAGRVEAVYEPTDLAALTADLASVFRSAVERAGVRLAIDCAPLAEPVYVDNGMWEKIVLNLLSNAFKFTFEGEIAVRLRQVGGAVELAVSDTGIGIAEDELPRLFERFHRVEGARGRTYEGSGIGLALVQELAKIHGGTARVDSALGQGSTFTVSIPLGVAHLPKDRIGVRPMLHSHDASAEAFVEEALRWLPDPEAGDFGLEARGDSSSDIVLDDIKPLASSLKPRVLLADDNADMRDYVRRLLSQRYEVAAVADGDAALAAARHWKPDLVLSDVMMPKLDGFGLLRALRAEKRTATIPVILLSARAGEEARIEGLEAGADDYLVKPFSARELLSHVDGHLKLAQVRREVARREQELTAEAQAARDRLEAVLASIGDQFLVLDRQWRYVYLNQRVVEVTGMQPEDLLGRSILDLFPALAGGVFERETRRAMAEQTAVHFEYYYPEWDRWFENHAYPSEAGLTILVADVSERRRAEAALRESEERQRFLSNLSEQFRHVEEPDELLWLASRAVGEHLQVSRCLFNEIDLEHDREIVHRDYCRDVPSVAGENHVSDYSPAALAEIMTGRTIVNDDSKTDSRTAELYERTYAPNGERAYVAVPLFREGRWVATLWVSADQPRQWKPGEVALLETVAERVWLAVERLRAEQALRASEARYRDLAEAMPQLVWTSDAGGAVDYYNSRAADYAGIEQTGAGYSWQPVLHPDDRDPTIAAWRAAQADGSYEFEHRMRMRDGTYRWHLSRALPARDKSGRIVKWFGTATDIHERKLAEQEARSLKEQAARLLVEEQAARQQAEEASRLKDEFLATVSHELRTPLTAFLGYALMLQHRRRDETYIARTLEKMVRSAKAQAQLIEDLLDVSRIVTGKLYLDPQPTDLAGVTNAAIDAVRPAVEAKALRLRVDLGPEVEPVIGDPNRLQQVVWNLLSNAVKFTPDGGAIDVQLRREGRYARLSVSDTGQGISEAFLPYVFDRFRQADSSSNRMHGGLGLGLAIVRHLVELHGGTVEAHSDGPQRGAIFTVRLPLASAAERPLGQLAGPDGAGACPPELAGLRVLVVDDQADIRELVRDMLAQCGAVVETSGSAREALAALREWAPDMLVSDIAMPEDDGYWLIRQVRSLAPEDGGAIPAIALTAYVRVEDRARVMAAGFQMYVPKPVEPSELRSVVANLARAQA